MTAQPSEFIDSEGLFNAVLEGTDGPDRILYLRQICQHTGDVMKCVRGVLAKNRYHLRTGQKRAVVKLLETYPVEDFKANLILSRLTLYLDK